MTLNPEFRRNLWLELTPQRLIAMPLVLGLIFTLVVLADDGHFTTLGGVGENLFYILVLLWGCRRAAASVAGEVREGTWDWQRMSAIGPWAMSWGKLLGSTAFVWYGGVLCLAAAVVGWASEIPLRDALVVAVTLIGAGLLGQMVSLAASLAWLRKVRPTRRLPVSLCQFLGVILGYLAARAAGSLLLKGGRLLETITWYAWEVDVRAFVAASLLAFLVWSMLACYRLMQSELQVRAWPWAWAAFTVFTMVYGNGLLLGRCPQCAETMAGGLVFPYAAAVAALYVMMFLEPKDEVRGRRWIAALRGGNLQIVMTAMPTWLPALLLGTVLGVLVAISALRAPVPVSWSIYLPATMGQQVAIAVVAHFGFILRDMALFLALNLGARRRRADLAALIYLAVLYVLLPSLLNFAGPAWGAALFLPASFSWPNVSLVAAGCQAAAAAAFLIWRWRARQVPFGALAPSTLA